VLSVRIVSEEFKVCERIVNTFEIVSKQAKRLQDLDTRKQGMITKTLIRSYTVFCSRSVPR